MERIKCLLDCYLENTYEGKVSLNEMMKNIVQY